MMNAFKVPPSLSRPSYRRLGRISSSSHDNFQTDVMTLTRFMIEATRSNPDHSDIESLMQSITIACKTIANLVSRSGITDLTGVQIATPIGEDPSARKREENSPMQLDKVADRVLRNALRFTGKLGVLGSSSETDKAIIIEESWNSGYVAVFDPLDGLSNLDIGLSTGTVFGIFREEEACLLDFGEGVSSKAERLLLSAMSPVSNIVAAGYCMYSSTTTLVFSLGSGLGVHGFTLDPNIGIAILPLPFNPLDLAYLLIL